MSEQAIQPPADHPGIKIPPPLIPVGIFFVGLLLQKLLPIPGLPQLFSRVAGLILIGAGILLPVWSFTLFRRARTSPFPIKPSTALVTSGPYRVTRNPMYLGLMSLYVGAALCLKTLWPLILSPIVLIAIQLLLIKKEEQYLERKFGAEYLRYKSRVRRWL